MNYFIFQKESILWFPFYFTWSKRPQKQDPNVGTDKQQRWLSEDRTGENWIWNQRLAIDQVFISPGQRFTHIFSFFLWVWVQCKLKWNHARFGGRRRGPTISLQRVNYASDLFCSVLFSKGKKGDSSNSDHEFEHFWVKFHLILIVLNSIDELCRNSFKQEKRREIHVDLVALIASTSNAKASCYYFFPLFFSVLFCIVIS